jgi:hypothetical protein
MKVVESIEGRYFGGNQCALNMKRVIGPISRIAAVNRNTATRPKSPTPQNFV